MSKINVVAIGQVPPPVTGQAVMIRMMATASYRKISVTLVPMVLSREVGDMGHFGFTKILRMLYIPVQAIYQRFRQKARILYYPPSGPVKMAVLRDIFILLLTRPFFEGVVLHFHAGGLSQIYPTFPRPIRYLYRKAFFNANVLVRISNSSLSEMEHLQGRREIIVPNGVPDPVGPHFVRKVRASSPLRLLFVGHLIEGKGILILLNALALLLQKGIDVELTCIGHWGGAGIQQRAQQVVESFSLERRVSFPGGLVGESKWAYFEQAHIFCFPSFFHSEVFPLVLLEAMAYSLPIVSTRWRGIPDVVEENVNGLLVETHDVSACADALARLIRDPQLRETFGKASRARFLACFRADVHLASMEDALLAAVAG